jgi:hypothetical protein
VFLAITGQKASPEDVREPDAQDDVRDEDKELVA